MNSKLGNLDRLQNLDDNKNPRNRIQAVHNVVKNGDEINEFDANYNVDQNEDKAKENEDEDFENDDVKDNDDLNNNTGEKEEVPKGNDSNQAIETFKDSDEQGDNENLDEDIDDEQSLILPPKDGSLKVAFLFFSGFILDIILFI